MDQFTAHELSLMEKMTPEYRALMPHLSPAERHSLAENVNLDNIDLIQSWIKTGEENEKILFWDKGAKYDNPEWNSLKPVDETTALLYEKAKKHCDELRAKAVEVQMRSDLTLYSQFNPALIFTGLAGVVRCRSDGVEDEGGGFFKGVELRCIGSVEENINSITIYPIGLDEFEVHFGSRRSGKSQGIYVYAGDSYSLLQLANLTNKDLAKLGYETVLRDRNGKTVLLDPKSIRRAARVGEGSGHREELVLHFWKRVKGMEQAIETADNLSRCLYNRFGLETECYKIGKKYSNFFIMRNDNFDRFLPEKHVENKGLVMFTATLVCRRCRRELEAFRDFAKSYPDVTFALVNLASPQFKFYERVFADMGGGDPKSFRDCAAGITPFVILYVPDERGVLKFAEYYGTEKADEPPSFEKSIALINKYFR